MKYIPISRPFIGEEEVKAVIDVLRSGFLAHGPEVEAFEREFAEYIGIDYAIAVANGTVALDLMLKAIGIGSGDEVVTTPFTFIATANSILYQGARPVFADIELDTYNIDPDSVLEKITNKTRAILAVHLYGHPADIKALKEIAEDHGILLLEDAAQAHGAEYYGRKVGSLGYAAAFSFYATKNMTTGEGGMVVTNDRALAEKIRRLRNHGQSRKYVHEELGWNYRMTSIAAAIGRIQLRKLEQMNSIRRRNAEHLTRLLSRIPGIRTPIEKPWARHVYHQYVIWVGEEYPLSRDELASYLKENGVGTAIHYPVPVFMQPLYRRLGYSDQLCPNAVEASRHVLSLPVHPLVKEEDIEYIASKIAEATSQL